MTGPLSVYDAIDLITDPDELRHKLHVMRRGPLAKPTRALGSSTQRSRDTSTTTVSVGSSRPPRNPGPSSTTVVGASRSPSTPADPRRASGGARRDIDDPWTGYGVCHQDAVREINAANTVVVYDPFITEGGRPLLDTLTRFASASSDDEPHTEKTRRSEDPRD